MQIEHDNMQDVLYAITYFYNEIYAIAYIAY